MSFQNGAVERALAKVCRVPESGIPAFRGKLRHLRELGIPRIEKTGSGRRAQFSRFDVISMRFALELTRLGVKPQSVAGLTNDAQGQLKGWELVQDVFFVVIEMPAGYTWVAVSGSKGIADIAEKEFTSFFIINISRLVAQVDEALKG